MKEKNLFLTGDRYDNARTTEADEMILHTAATGEGAVQVTPEMFMDMAKQARATFDRYHSHILQIMTKERAEMVYDLRERQRCTWRAVAVACWAQWKDADWHPATNQLAGMALCRIASNVLKINFD
jgi:hypothetical protein